MYKIGDYVIYRRDLCKVVDVKEKYIHDQDYYILVPVDDESLKLSVPASQNEFLRAPVTREEIEDLISKISSIEIIDSENRNLENIYQGLLQSGSHVDLIKIIKTTYLRNQERLSNKKKIGEKDDRYFQLAEKYLYNELAVVLEMNYDDAKDYVVKQVAAHELLK